jgi:hypothetical protein
MAELLNAIGNRFERKTTIKYLTPEQEDLRLFYKEKWMQIVDSTEQIDRETTSKLVKEAYLVIDAKEPEIIFCHSPYEAASLVLGCKSIAELYEKFGVNLFDRFEERIYNSLQQSITEQIAWYVMCHIFPKEGGAFTFSFTEQLYEKLGKNPKFFGVDAYGYIDPIIWSGFCVICDFCFSVLKCEYDRIKWQTLQSLTTQCGWIFPYEKVCIVCDRPRILSFDSQHRLHAAGGPAIQFADGYSIYSYHGVTLPEKYGKLHPHQWQSQWLLSEENAELKRVLIQGIGYDRICQELAAIELDSWQEYTLLKIDTNFDVEPI